MAPSLGIFSGAGISTSPPAGLPSGDEFHALLLAGCRDAARTFAPHAVSDDGIRLLLEGGRRNILGCIEDCLPVDTTADVLDCMRVYVPSESQLLCAVHAAYGTPNITINFDNGIELAHALLIGAAALPHDVPEVYHEALARWRPLMPDRTPLRVISTPAQLARREPLMGRPTLVKLRGSVDRGTDSTVIPLRPVLEDMESTRLDEDRFAALAAVAGCDHLLVTGHSGRDLDCFESLRLVLRPGAFTWVAPELEPSVVARIAAVDRFQPRFAHAEEVLRSLLPELPAWPQTGWDGSRFTARFAAWWSGLPPAATAEAYAWLLADAGRFREPIAILRGLLRSSGSTRLRLRLADVLVRRGLPADLAEADRIFAAAMADEQPYPRFDLAVRRAQARTGATLDELVAMLDATLIRLIAEPDGTGSGAARDDLDGRAAIRCVTILSRLIRARAEAVEDASAVHHLLLRVWSSLRTARRHADRLGTGARQTDLELEIVAVDSLLALHRGPPLPADAAARLAAVERAYSHRGDAVGGLQVLSVRALAWLATGRSTRVDAAIAELTGRGAGQEYAHIAERLSMGLRRTTAATTAGRDECEVSDHAGSTPSGAQRG